MEQAAAVEVVLMTTTYKLDWTVYDDKVLCKRNFIASNNRHEETQVVVCPLTYEVREQSIHER